MTGMTRRQVLQKCYCAKSLEQVEDAFLARAYWLREHPDDGEIFHVGEMLAKLKDGFELEAKSSGPIAADVATVG